MRIAFVLSHINQSTQWVWFSEELIRRKIPHVFIIINPVYPPLADELKALGATVYYLPHRGFIQHIKNLFQVISLLRKHRISVVHSELPMGNLMGQSAARCCFIRARVVTCENTTWAEDFNSSRQQLIDSFAYRSAKKVVALTNEASAYLEKKFNVPAKKLMVIPHSLKQREYEDIGTDRVAELRNSLFISPDDFVIGMVARFEYWKGHRYAVEALHQLSAEFPQVKLHIIGGKGESFAEVMSVVKQYGLQQKVYHHEYVADNKALYHLFDVHLHVPINTLCETFGITIIEGMISARPQVLTLSGISVQTADNEKNCLVVDYCSATAIYKALKKIILDPELGKRLGEQAKLDAIRMFNYKDKVEQHLDMYADLLASSL